MVLIAGCTATTTGPSGQGASDTVTGGSSVTVGRPGSRSNEAGVVEVAYRRLWTVAETIPSLPPARWRELLSTVAGEPLLTQLHDGFRAQREAGRRDYGIVVLHPSVVAIDGRRASVLDCQDASRSGELDLDTGLPVTVGHARTPLAATLTSGPDRRWRVSQLRYLNSSC